MTLPVNPGPEPFTPVPSVPRPTEPDPDKPSDPAPDDDQDLEDDGMLNKLRGWLGFRVLV
jgi:hypothetical protein